MGWFTKKVTDPNEAFSRLISNDKKVSMQAHEEFSISLTREMVVFLCEKFEENLSVENRLKILEIFGAVSKNLTIDDLQIILKLLVHPETLLRQAFKDILKTLDEDRLRPITDYLCRTTDVDIRSVLQSAIEGSGVVDALVKKWAIYSAKEKIMYLEQIVLLQNPKLFPIVFDILKEEVVEAKKEEKKLLQVEFSKHIEKIKDPAFLDQAVANLPAIDSNLWYPVFKCLQAHGDAFFKKIFENLDRKSEQYRIKLLQLVEKLTDPISFPYLFPFLLDKFKTIPPIVQNIIQSIVKRFSEELEQMDSEKRKSKETAERIAFFIGPLESHLNDTYAHSSKIMSECILRIGRWKQEIILRNLPRLHKYNESYLNNFLKGLDGAVRKELLISACTYPKTDTGKTALILLSNPSENFIIETLNSLLLEYFMSIPPEIQAEIINLMMDPRLKRFVEEVLYHQDPQLRSRILTILGESGSTNALTILQTKVHDPDYSVREVILKLLQLKHFQNERGTEVMLDFLKDSEPTMVMKAIDIMRDRDHPKLLANLTKLMAAKDEKVKKAAHGAISYITRRKFMQNFDHMTPETRYAIGMSLIKMDQNFLYDVTQDLSSMDQRTRILAARILEVLVEHIPPDVKTNLIVAIQDPDPQVRAVVVMGLGKIGGPSVGNMLVQFLQDPDDRVRANAVEAMALVGDLSLVDQILPCINDKNNRVRGNVIVTLWKLGYYQIYDSVIEMLRNPDKWMRASAAFSLGELKDLRFFPVLIQCMRDPEADVRRNVIVALGKLAEPYVLAPYIRQLRFDPDEKVRKSVQDILSAPQKKPQGQK